MSCLYLLIGAIAAAVVGAAATAPPRRETSAFYPASMVERARANIARTPEAAAERERLMKAAEPWRRMGDDQLWRLMFGCTITRSWMVWSNGWCPACKQSVPMYTWRMDALGDPWKVRCPRCGARFPTNDFAGFYRSGLDEHGVFDPGRADRTQLYNAGHPDPADPLHAFGVDDGEGFVQDGHRWRFVGAYLIYGQWKQAIVGGIWALAQAYVVTGDPAYAHKAGVLLDRVADLYPTFDFHLQGQVYERQGDRGYVSTWHDACEETRQMALAYDAVLPALRADAGLPAFLAARAREVGLPNPKATWEDVRRNIEDGLLHHPVANRARIESNFPRTDVCLATLKTVLGWPGNREEVLAALDPVIRRSTAVDGVTGEKGLAGYTAFDISGLADLLARYARMDPAFLPDMLRRYPRLRETWRFHLDTWIGGQYYPEVGDTGAIAQRATQYVGVGLSRSAGVEPSMFAFLWQLYKLTGDVGYVQAMVRGNGDSVDGLPHDLFASGAAALQREARRVTGRAGPTPERGSVNKREWRLAILRSGKGASAPAAWMAYDAGGPHGHMNGMNLGLFAYGLDLLPDLGYPPVQYGGWGAPRATWYVSTLSHNTVVVDGKDQAPAKGACTLWADGRAFRAVRASCPGMIGGTRYERTVAMVDGPAGGCYVLDVFHVVGGSEHVRLLHSAFGALDTPGLALKPTAQWGGGQMRAFAEDPAPRAGWLADWRVEDRFRYLPAGPDVHLRCVDLTPGTSAMTAQAWVSYGGYDADKEDWIPVLGVRRRLASGAPRPLASTFVCVLEPYAGAPAIESVRRLDVAGPDGTPAAYGEGTVAVEVRHRDGTTDLLLAGDPDDPAWAARRGLAVSAWGVSTDGELCMVRRDAAGSLSRVALCRGSWVRVGRRRLQVPPGATLAEFAEFEVRGGRARLVPTGK